MIYTSYFGNWRKFPKDSRLVSVARGIPGNADNIELCSFSCVQPTHRLLFDFKNDRIDTVEYTSIYSKQLHQLEVEDFVKEYENSILLCYEKTGDFCHRHLLTHYVNSKFKEQRVIEF